MGLGLGRGGLRHLVRVMARVRVRVRVRVTARAGSGTTSVMVSFGALATAGRYSYLVRERVGVSYS